MGGAATCSEGFVICFLKVPLAFLGSMAAAVPANSLGNSQKTFYKTFGTSGRPTRYTVADLWIWCQQTVFRDQMDHPVQTVKNMNIEWQFSPERMRPLTQNGDITDVNDDKYKFNFSLKSWAHLTFASNKSYDVIQGATSDKSQHFVEHFKSLWLVTTAWAGRLSKRFC